MIIKQRTTMMDSFLLKVVFPYLDAGNHRSLMRLARIWNNDISARREARRRPAPEPVGTGALVWLQNSLRAVGRSAQPQTLAPIAVVNHRSSRRVRAYKDNV